MGSVHGRSAALLLAVAALFTLPAGAHAQGPLGPLNDLLALGEGQGQQPDRMPTLQRAEPPLVASPRAVCAPGSRTEPGIQGRVPAGSATNGFICNLELIAHQGTSGGFRVWRYVDTKGRECAYYDTALLFPLNAFKFDANSLGVAVLDMSDPAHPVQTDMLTELPMLSPHESLNVNAKRGLIGAVLGNPSVYPGMVSFYDAHEDCRHPKHTYSGVLARFGHESGFSPDGNTFYATAVNANAITAIDVKDPYNPHVVWLGNINSHGMGLSDDGNRGYLADTSGQLTILDTSEIQARKANPQAKEIARLTWKQASIPQNNLPFTRDGKPYLLEFDEYGGNVVGAGRIIDISNEREPKVVGNLRLQINQEEDVKAAKGDPGAFSPVQGYAAHYCNIPQEKDPQIVACSFIASGLRVFDIRDLTQPKEIAYYVAPTVSRVENGTLASDYAMSMPAFAPERREIWYSDGTSGFNVLRVPESVWPTAAKPSSGACASRRTFATTHLAPKGSRIRSVTATLGGKRVKATYKGRVAKVRVDLRKLTKSVVRLKVRIVLRGGRVVTKTRTYHPCTRRG